MSRFRVAFVVAMLVLAGCGGTSTPTPGPVAGTDVGATATPVSSPSSTTASEGAVVTVVRVVDGDTFEVRYRNGSTDTVRLLGVDTPEVHVENDPAEFEGIPNTPDGRAWLRDWGHEASEFARTQVGGERVRLVFDARADRRGRYGRLLAYVFDDDGLFNRRLLERGYARLYDSPFTRRESFAAAESTARANRVGVWGYAATTPVADGGTSLAVVEIHADAAGNDHENTNDEYVVFENAGTTGLDLSGWRVRDDAGHTYVVPSGFVLEPGERVTLYTGDGTDTESSLYWGSGTAIWNNGGDTVTVLDDAGRVVLERSY